MAFPFLPAGAITASLVLGGTIVTMEDVTAPPGINMEQVRRHS